MLGVPAHELRDLRVPLADLWPGGQVRRLTERVSDATEPAAALEAVIAVRVRDVRPPDPLLAAVVASLRAGEPVSSVARASGLGERQLHRRCLAAFGYGPKVLARVLRMQRTLVLARTGTPFADVAVLAGYADQSHPAREMKALAGAPLGELVPKRAQRRGPQGLWPYLGGSSAKRSTPLPSGSPTTAYRMPQKASQGFRCPA